jgi:AraC-like DNA-binding protein
MKSARNPRIQKYHEKYQSHAYSGERFEPPLRIVGAVVSRWGPGDNFRRTKRETLSLSLVTQGVARYVQEGRTGLVNTGDLFVAQRGHTQIFETGASGFLHKRSLLIEGPGVDAMMIASGLSETDVVRPLSVATMTALFRAAYRVMRDKPPGFALELSRIAYAIILECARSTAPEYPTELREAVAHVRRNLHRPISLAEIADQARLSVRQCNRVFNRHLRLSPKAFVICQKMAQAGDLLLNTTDPVKHVAAAVGYDDPLRFSAQFKRQYGLSPRAYRRRSQDSGQSAVAGEGLLP